MTKQIEVQTKAVVSVSEMARMVGLSRARFYQLTGTAFPRPLTDSASGRPVYTEEMQRVCLEVRRRNCGVDGRPLLFYARRLKPTATRQPRKALAPSKRSETLIEIVEAVQSLGMAGVKEAQVAAIVKELYPEGLAGTDLNQAIRAVFLALRRQDSGDNVGR